MEYVAIFIAVLFPGALVALNYDLLENLPLFSMLQIYCAGIWHNVMVSYVMPCRYPLCLDKKKPTYFITCIMPCSCRDP
jgi:hypothetical protein